MMNILVVDDERLFKFSAIYARTSAAGIRQLESRPFWDELWLDHDLGVDDRGVEDTIYPVIHYLEKCAFYGHIVEIDRVVICTANPVGRKMIERALSPLYPIEHVDAAEYVVRYDTSRPNPSTILGRMYDERPRSS